MLDELEVSVVTAKGLFTGTFSQTDKLSDVRDAAIDAMDLDNSDSLEFVYDGEVLGPLERTLVSFGFEESVSMDLVAAGSGV